MALLEQPDLNFDRSAIVVAHPDDEILWFSSIINRVSQIVICFLDVTSVPRWSKGRREVLSSHPLKNIRCLEVIESEVFSDSNWQHATPVNYGIKIKNDNQPHLTYINNFHNIVKRLEDILAENRHVFTHNPWGEYGNEEHVQVFNAVNQVRNKLHYHLWCSNYCSNKSLSLMKQCLSDRNYEYITLNTDKKTTSLIKSIYQAHHCWTWFDDWDCFSQESFIKMPAFEKNPSYGHNVPINMVNVQISVAKDSKPNTVSKLINKAKNVFRFKRTPRSNRQ